VAEDDTDVAEETMENWTSPLNEDFKAFFNFWRIESGVKFSPFLIWIF